MNKGVYPGYYEVSAGGSVLAGESALDAIKREVLEETGIKDGIFYELGKNIFYEYNCLNVSFKCITNIKKDNVKLQKSETIDYIWISKNDYEKLINQENTDKFKLIPSQKERHKRYIFSIN